MIPTSTSIFILLQRFLGFAVLLQSIEMLQLKRLWTENGIWDAQLVFEPGTRFPILVKRVIETALAPPIFQTFLLLAAVSSAILVVQPNPYSLAIMSLTTIAVAIRWRGTFNGGSDCMTFLLLLTSLLIWICGRTAQVFYYGLWYIAFQTCLSFFISGWVKIRQSQWRSGQSLINLLEKSAYPIPTKVRLMAKPKILSLALSWLVILFEISFPMALVLGKFSLVLICLAIIFQVVNFILFGLNRFFWAWLAAYPAVIYVSLSLAAGSVSNVSNFCNSK